MIVQKLSQVSGVGAVTVEGGQTRAVRLQANPAQLAGLGLSLDDVRRAIAATTVDTPKGALDGPRQAFQIGANDQLLDGCRISGRVVAYRNGAPGAAARCRPRHRRVGKRRAGGVVQRRAGGDPRHPAPAGRQHHRGGRCGEGAAAEARTQSLPPALKISVVTDRTVTIRAAIADVQFTLVLDRRAGGAGDLPVPAQAVGDGHPERHAAGFADRDLRRRWRCWASASTICR